MVRKALLLVFVLPFVSMAAEAESPFQIGPIPGLTSGWHAAPETALIPLGSTPATLTFRRQKHFGATVIWDGATPVSSSRRWSVAEVDVKTSGRYVVTVEYVYPTGRRVENRCIFDVVDFPPELIQISPIEAAVDPVALDENDLNASTYEYFRGESIAGLRQVSENHYRTSIKRWVSLSVDVDPPEFEPLIEWRSSAGLAPALGASWKISHARPVQDQISVGPLAAPQEILLETYSAEITSHLSNQTIIPTNAPVTFTAVTRPPGFEDEIIWMASTLYGTSEPVMGQGGELVVQFEDTWGPYPGTDRLFQWLGVKADNAMFNQDQKPSCTIIVYRDLPRWTHPLGDWPESAQCPRSPRYVFGKDRVISIEVLLNDTAQQSLVVEVENPATGSKVLLTLELDGGIYRNRTPDEDLYLLDETLETPQGDFIHVREEEVLEFKVLRHPLCRVDWMVDRGEAAAATPKDEETARQKHPMENGFVRAATAFMDGATGFDPLTTPWFDVGRKLRAPCTDPYGGFVLAAGDDDADDKEADFLHVGGHSHVTGQLGGGDSTAAGGWCDHFIPKKSSLFRKNPADPVECYFDDPSKWYWGSVETTASFFANPAQWDTDMDWAMLYSCHSLDDTRFDVGTHKFDPDYVGIGQVTGAEKAWERWKVAFTGNRALHGILGFKGTGSGSNTIKGVIEKWVALVKGGKSIPRAWLKVTRDNGDTGAVVFIPRDFPDTIDTMQRDACQGDQPMYLSTGQTDGTKKKIIDGKFKKAGILPSVDPAFDPETVYTVFYSGTPTTTLADGQCSVWIDLPTTTGTFPRLIIERGEQLAAGSPFALTDDGIYAFDLSSAIPLDANTITSAEAEQAVRDTLAAGFISVPPDLETFGVFPGKVETENDSFESGFEVVLEQRIGGLTLFDSEVYALVTPEGNVDLAEATFYASSTSNVLSPLESATSIATIAAQDLLVNHPAIDCRITDMQAFYGYPVPAVGPGQVEVRPVWGIELNLGEAIYTVDAVDGTILEVELASE